MNDLESLEYDELMHRLKDDTLKKYVADNFSGYNDRVLLSAFMLKKFNEELSIPDELHESSVKIVQGLLNNNIDIIANEYPVFFQLFNEWRVIDINTMKGNIKDTIGVYETMVAPPPTDPADDQWNEGITQSIKIMSEKVDVLDELAHTPPKY